MNDLQNNIFLFQNPIDFGRALKKKNYEMTQLIEQILVIGTKSFKHAVKLAPGFSPVIKNHQQNRAGITSTTSNHDNNDDPNFSHSRSL